MIRDKSIAKNAFIAQTKVAGFGVGEVFYVYNSADTAVGSWLNARVPAGNLFTDIQLALDATVESRNDYVYVWPSGTDYDTTATLSLSKRDVHLIGLSNQYECGCSNGVKLHCGGDVPGITIADCNIEVAGLWIKNHPNYNAILINSGSYGLDIHHCNFQMAFSSSPKAMIEADDDGGSWGYLCHHCNFIVYAASGTIAKIIETGPTGGGGYVCNYNNFQIHGGCTATTCIDLTGGSGSCANFNTFGSGGGASGGTITHCITIGVSDSCIGNRGTVDAGALIVGGTAVKSYSMNYCHDVVDET